jgi:hypothetical protein
MSVRKSLFYLPIVFILSEKLNNFSPPLQIYGPDKTFGFAEPNVSFAAQ